MLTDSLVRATEPRRKAYKLSDERGLHLLVSPSGARLWRFKYRFDGKQKTLALGNYVDVTLKRARQKRDEARALLVDGIDPSEKRKIDKRAAIDTFEAVAREWLLKQSSRLRPITLKKNTWLLEFIFQGLGSNPISRILAPDLLAELRRLESRGKLETMHRAKQIVGQVMRYAVATGRANRDITSDLKGALTAKTVRSHAAITEPARIGELLRAIDGYEGQASTACALKLAPLVFVRPGELRAAEWSEINVNRAEWRIPAERMKMREEHLVPLSLQSLKIIEELKKWTGKGRYLFPALANAARPMSNNTINGALRRLGYSHDEMTGHGFRTTASTSLNEMGWHPDLIELQLAHQERNSVRAAYNKAQRLGERRKMMQAWADYLDKLRATIIEHGHLS